MKNRLNTIFAKNKKIIIIAVITALMIILFFIGGLLFYKNKIAVTDTSEMMNGTNAKGEERQAAAVSDNQLTATGTTELGINYENFPLDYIDTALEIEEVYLSEGSEAEAGTRLLKVTEESLNKAKEELEDALKEAKTDYQTARVAYDTNVLTAKNTYDNSVAAGERAEIVYNNTLAQLQADINDAEDALKECNVKTAEYNNALNNNTFYSGHDVEGKLNNYNEKQALLAEKQNELSAVEIQSTSSQTEELVARQSSLQSEITALETAVKTAKTSYEEAVKGYEEDVAEAKSKITELDNSYDSLTAKLEDARLAYEEKSAEALETYETTMQTCQNAKTAYENTLQKLELEMQELADAQTEAQNHTDEFESILGDGCYYTQNQGIIAAINAEAEGTLMTGSYLLAYYDTETLTVSISVDQSNISSVAVGDSCSVMVSPYGNYDGLVTRITPTSSSASRSSVAYEAVVAIQGDVSGLTSGLSAQVVFTLPEVTEEQDTETKNSENITEDSQVNVEEENQ